MKTDIWQKLLKETGGVQHPICLVSYLQPRVRLIQNISRTDDWDILVYMLVGFLAVFHSRQLTASNGSLKGTMSSEFAFMDDNARLHQANIVNECLQSEFITPIEWPAFSPGMNLALHVCACLTNQFQLFNHVLHVYRNFGEHCLRCDENNLPLDQLDNLILSMPRCCTE
ncbi:transposable element Tcb1 transposase [Trichonephila clavipes]|nr:transposable element Tcb1 transposase [Trichonephila clavipes]